MRHTEETCIDLGVKINKRLIINLSKSCMEIAGTKTDVRISIDNVLYDSLDEFTRCYYEKEINKWHIVSYDYDLNITWLISSHHDKLNISVDASDSVKAQELITAIKEVTAKILSTTQEPLQVSEASAYQPCINIKEPVNVVLTSSEAERSYVEARSKSTFKNWISQNKYEIIKGIIFMILGSAITYVFANLP